MSGAKIALDARVTPGLVGGVEQVIRGLAHGLARLETEQQFSLLTYKEPVGWQDSAGAGLPLLRSTEEPFEVSAKAALKRRIPGLKRALGVLPPLPGLRHPDPPQSDGTIERAGIDVMHFTTQRAFFTSVPSIYMPYDLQHVHHPELFSPREVRFRETSYRAHCESATFVVVMSEWAKADLVDHYGLDKEKVVVIPGASTLTLYERREDRTKVGPSASAGDFILYPAQTWPHKNHVRLFEALKIARHRHPNMSLVCTGTQTDHHQVLLKHLARLDLSSAVHFTGYVSPQQLLDLFDRARCLIFPTLFEGWGFPVVEAFEAGVPVASSNVTHLPELADGAALLFDPVDVDAMAAALDRIWSDEPLRASLVVRGRERLAHLSWKRTAERFSDLYARVLEVSE